MGNGVKPGRWLYWLAAGIGLLGTALFLILGVVGIRGNLVEEVRQRDALTRLLLPAVQEPVALESTGPHAIFIEHHPGDEPSEFEVVIEDDEGAPVELYEPVVDWSYDREELTGEAFATFDVDKPGTFIVDGGYIDQGDGEQRYAAVGPWKSTVGAVGLSALGLGGAVLCALGGLAIGVTAWLLRRKAMRTGG